MPRFRMLRPGAGDSIPTARFHHSCYRGQNRHVAVGASLCVWWQVRSESLDEKELRLGNGKLPARQSRVLRKRLVEVSYKHWAKQDDKLSNFQITQVV